MDTMIVGNLCHDPILRQSTRGSAPFAKFTIAVNSWRRAGDGFVERPPVFHRVVCFGQLAENVTNSLRRGMEVVAMGQWADDSYSDESGQRKVQITLEARNVGPTLRWATAQVHRAERQPEPDRPPAQTIPLDLGEPPPNPRLADPDLTPAPKPLAELSPAELRKAAEEIGAELIPATSLARITRRRKKPDPEPLTANTG